MPSTPSAITKCATERRASSKPGCYLLVTFDQRDHPSHVARPGCYLLIIDPIVHKKRLTKVLMDGASGLNILYVDTLNTMRIP